MSEKKARAQRKEDRTTRPAPRREEIQDLPPPNNFTTPYTLAMKDQLFTWYAWQVRPKPLMRRLFLVLIVAFVWIAFLTQGKPIEEKWTAYLLCLVAVPLYLAVAATISTIMGFLSYSIKKGQFTDAVLYWDDERVEWITPVYSPKYKWSQFKAHFITTKVIILALQGTLIAVPVRAFKTAHDLQNFTENVQRKAVGPKLGFAKKK